MDELFIHAKILLHYLVLYVLLYTSHPVSILLRVCNEHLFEASDIPRPVRVLSVKFVGVVAPR